MRFIPHLCSCILAITLASCQSELRVNLDAEESNLLDSNGVLYQNLEPFTGLGFTMNDSGNVATETTFLNGLKDGPFKTYTLEGKLAASGAYNKGMKVGPWTEFCAGDNEPWSFNLSPNDKLFKKISFRNDTVVGPSEVHRMEDSTLYQRYREFINQEGGYTPIDSVFEYRTSGELSGFYFYPDSSGIWTRLETYHENGQVHMTVEKRKHVPSKYKRMFRELKKANREYNLGTDLQSSLVDDSLALKVVYLKEYTESGKIVQNIKGCPALEEGYSVLQAYEPLLKLQAWSNLFGGGSSSYFGSSGSSSSSSYSSSRSSSTSPCSACNRDFHFKEWKNNGWRSFYEQRPGYQKCGSCDGYGFTDEYHALNYGNPTTRHRCKNSSCQNGWIQCRRCYGKGHN
ncbi:hypothetical protein OAO65_03145 [Flavobacteriales bacterium]|nr:hypothetical protein [Flavobacteriales bacterium]